MNKVSKSICLTEMEFRILQNWYGINELNGFEMDREIDANVDMQQVYNLGLFSLYKKKLIKSVGEEIVPADDVELIFRPLKRSKVCICVESDREEISSACLYFGNNNAPIIIMEPGTRDDEYARLHWIEQDELKDYLVDTGIIVEETSDKDIIELARNDEQNQIMSIKAAFIVTEASAGTEIGSVAIVENVLSDKILVKSEERIMEYPYTVEKTVEEIFNMVKQYDIS